MSRSQNDKKKFNRSDHRTYTDRPEQSLLLENLVRRAGLEKSVSPETNFGKKSRS
jgi:hypothetical protein